MSYKNFLFQALISVYDLFSKPTPTKSIKKFLIVSTTALGDTIWATPSIRSLKETFPNSSISVLTSSIGSQVLKNNPYIDEVFLLKKTSLIHLCKLYMQMRKRYFTTALFFHTSQRPILPFCYMLGIREMIGTKGLQKGLDSLLSTAVEKKPMHEIERRLKIIECVGAPATYTELEIFPQKRHSEEAQEWLENHGFSFTTPIVALHPGASTRFRQADPKVISEVAKLLQKNHKCQILITGTLQEKNLVDEITKLVPGAIGLAQNLDLHTFAALIGKMSALVVGDTGPMHIAFAMKTPTVALFPASNPLSFGPYQIQPNLVKVFHKPLTCTPCLYKKCQLPFCFLQFSPKEICDSVHDLLPKR